MAKNFAGKGLHFVMCDEGKQSADMAAMKLTELGVVSNILLIFAMRTMNHYLLSEQSIYKL